MAPVCDPVGPALEAAVSVTEAGYTAPDQPGARRATRVNSPIGWVMWGPFTTSATP